MTGLDATGTNNHFFNSAFMQRPHPLQVWIETPLGDVMCMADIIADEWFLSADFTQL